jgi:hypothetical protein
MKKKLKKEWIKALKSDDFIQGTGFLHSVDDNLEVNCCLGVLCEIVLENDSKLERCGDDELQYSFNKQEGMEHSLNTDMLKHVGLTQKHHDKLIALNDDDEKSFKKIAKWIKKKL